MKGCIRQIEHLNPSGASEQDILTRAKMLFAEDPKYTKGFKFDHVWNILKDIEKFGTDTMNTASMKSRQQNVNAGSSEQQFSEEAFHTPSSPCVSTFDLNITDSDSGGSSIKRPPGVKKAKMKKKNDEQIAKVININAQLVEAMNASTAATTKMADTMLYKEETKILFKDLNSISNPMMREYIRNEQIRIMQKRMQVQGSHSAAHQGEGSQTSQIQGEGSQLNQYQGEDQESQNPTNIFGQFHNYFSGMGSDLPEY
ncbi:uncharacterized protein LOC122043531 [Zingiber officinale]|uniref:uncharacterized protein LOC122043531 n=1 Tax=Zingiber officinale TaxID=94328 RepID=UPI001C4BB773|nr:uncharacterized protein LOC122043531 [Zingiber officinale]